MKKLNAVLLSLLFAATASAAPQEADNKKAMLEAINQKAPFTINDLKDSSVENMYVLDTDKGIYYATKDGKHLFAGNLFSIDGGIVNLTAEYKKNTAKERFVEYEETMITYKAKDEKHSVYVFTDISCGYCKKLHSQMKGYNDAGITVKYLAYPRNGLEKNGVGLITAKKMNTVWCEEDKHKALDTAIKAPYSVPSNTECVSPVEAHYNLGKTLLVGGTPAIFSSAGEKVSAYLSPQKLLAKLEQ